MKTSPQNGIVDISTYYYLPWRIIWVLGLVPLGAELILTGRPVFGTILILLCAPILTARYGIRVNFLTKKYADYITVLGFRSGEELAFSEIDYVFIKPNSESTTMHSRITSKTFKKDVYDVYLKFDGNEKVFLLSADNKKAAGEFAREVREKLNIDVVDYTQEPPVAG